MKKTIVSLLIATLLPLLSGTPTIKKTGEPNNVPPPSAGYQPFGQSETIHGSLMMLIKEQRLIVLKAEGGVPYNFRVTPATKIEIGGKNAAFEDLVGMTNANLSVTYDPLRVGNFARKIRVEQ
jgi:hypothetical protein